MSRTSNRGYGDVVRDFLAVAGLFENPQPAHLYTYLDYEDEVAVQDVIDNLELAQGTAYTYVP
ncbi:hypothetical protein HAPAU_30550 [Halalkalicoccus paucihalophilus]|uniref:Uncharacterized protein n=1 Tax=Halalkalicoccus paucihalophilus TaxID=1008153 RepID=A0A151AAN5_9EURY|nr:hypothetical protein HAPAU_30550 [Halalkalicoccus paucihalophilus]